MNSICRCKPLLGTFVDISIDADVSDDCLIKTSSLAFEAIERIQNLMGFHDKNSELSMINQFAFTQDRKISSETEEVLKMSLYLSRLSNGVFDISIAPNLIDNGLLPQHGFNYNNDASYKDILLNKNHVKFIQPLIIDLGGIAKGYAVDVAYNLIKSQLNDKIKNFTVNAGGDLRMHEWKGQYINVAQSKNFIKTIKMQAPAIATSANYYLEGKSAVFNPKNDNPVELKSSVSVFANSCMLADGLTKIAAITGTNHPIFNQINALAVQL